MTQRRALQTVLAISLFGVVFSGSLTWQELMGSTGASCPAIGVPGTLFGYPACVYGLVMYVLLSIVAAAGLRSRH